MPKIKPSAPTAPALGCRWLADAACRRERCPDGCQRFERAPFGPRVRVGAQRPSALRAPRRGVYRSARSEQKIKGCGSDCFCCVPLRFSGHKHASFGRGAVGGLCDERRENRNSCEGSLFTTDFHISHLLRLPCGRRLAAAAPPPRPPPLPPIWRSPRRARSCCARSKTGSSTCSTPATSACHCQSCRRIPYFSLGAVHVCAFVCVLATALCTRERPPPPPDAMFESHPRRRRHRRRRCRRSHVLRRRVSFALLAPPGMTPASPRLRRSSRSAAGWPSTRST